MIWHILLRMKPKWKCPLRFLFFSRESCDSLFSLTGLLPFLSLFYFSHLPKEFSLNIKLPFYSQVLYREWALPKNFLKRQPLWLIKRYFGDKIGLYFAWLGFYTGFLIPAALFGVAITIYGIVTMKAEWNYPTYVWSLNLLKSVHYYNSVLVFFIILID